MKRLIDGVDLMDKIRARLALMNGMPATYACEKVMNDIAHAQEITLNDLRDAIYEDAVAHGLWDTKDGPTQCAWLIREEARELDDAASNWEDEGVDEDEPDEAFCEELADVAILAFSVAGHMKIDIDAWIRKKMAINRERSFKHENE